MPSGSKKRKAAKKKRAIEGSHGDPSSANPSHGNDDSKSHVDQDSDKDNGVRSHDDKESDSGELNSPASLDQQPYQHPFGERDDGERRSVSSVQSFVPESKSAEATSIKPDDRDIEILDELKPVEEPESRNVTIECVESPKHPNIGASLGDDQNTSVSNSDNERKKEDSQKASVSLDVTVPEDVSLVIKSVQTAEASNIVKESSHSFTAAHSLPVEGAYNSGATSVADPVASCTLSSGLKEIEKLLSSPVNVPGVPSNVMNLESNRNEDEVLALTNETTRASPGGNDVALKENEDKLLPPSDVPNVGIDNVAEQKQDSDETPECSENQPLVASAPRPAKTTSWMSCCGLFDVVTGSER